MSPEKINIPQLMQEQKLFFDQKRTGDVAIRKTFLNRLKEEILQQETAICDALYKDLKKSEFEAKASETQFVLAELSKAIKKIKKWARADWVFPSLANFPSVDYIYKEPYGQVLIIAPWNYPFQLAIAPLIGAVAAGNAAIVKPSELTPQTSAILNKIISKVFPENYVKVVEGDAGVSKALLREKWDYIFFTGSTNVGKIVYRSAAEHLTPVTLELGGKNPCIIDETAQLPLAAKRICWGKFLNCGQTCIAPDYIMVHKSIKDQFITELKKVIRKAYGDKVQISADYPRIVNQNHFERLLKLIENEQIIFGGETDASDLYIAPTLIDEPSLGSAVMKGEIFGPLLPVIGYDNLDEIETVLANYEKPLSMYIFSGNLKEAKRFMNKFSFGGGAINDTVVHIINKNLPFGGVGNSGIGSYHGKKSFDVFSHHKPVVRRANWLDLPLRYPPYKSKMNLVNYIKHFL